MSKIDLIEQDLWDHYSGLPSPKWYEYNSETQDQEDIKTIKHEIPCNPDHNGECLVCDCWLDNCAYDRFQNEDYTYETKEELEKMFNKNKL